MSSLQEANPSQSLTKQATTFDYFAPSDGALDGLLKDVSSPTPDTVDGSSTVTTSYTYSLPVLTGTGYAAGGNVLTMTDPGNETGAITTTYNYTADGSYNATGQSGTFSQNEAVGEPLTVALPATSDGETHVTHLRYDGRGNRTYVIDASGYVTTWIYNLANQMVAMFYPPVSGNPTGAYETYTYQYPGGPLQSASLYSEGTAYPPMSATPYRTTTCAYDHEGQTLSATDLKGLLSSATYDARGRLATSADGQGNTTRYAYTLAGSLYQELYPGYTSATPGSFDTQTYGYDPDQNVTQMEDGRGVTTSYQRMDPESLVTQTSYGTLPSGVTAINSVLYAYDGYGREASMDDTAGTGQAGSRKVYAYDDLDELESVTTSFTGGPQNQTLTYAHNNDGSRKSLLTPTSASVSNPLLAAGYLYAHDQAHRLAAVTFPWLTAEASSAEQQKLSYFSNGWLDSSANSQARSSCNYDARGFLTSLTNDNNYTGDDYTFYGDNLSVFSGFGYDAAGNRTGFAASIPENECGDNYDFSHTLTYAYDGRDELTGETSVATGSNTAPSSHTDVYAETFGYDLAENRTSESDSLLMGSPFSYMFGADNQNDSGGFTYDGSGNPTQYNGSANAYSYDPEERLTAIGSGFSAHYDGDGMRDYTTTSSGTTYYLYDGSSPVIEETYSGSTTTIAYANGFADGWRERYTPAGPAYFAFCYDPQGSLSATSDSVLQDDYPNLSVSVYDGFGNRVVSQEVDSGMIPAGHQDPAQFGGQYGYYTDTSTGEVDLTHRYYDASTGHFLNRDPIGYAGGANLYAFCGNNPINESDPDGTTILGVYFGTSNPSLKKTEAKIEGDIAAVRAYFANADSNDKNTIKASEVFKTLDNSPYNFYIDEDDFTTMKDRDDADRFYPDATTKGGTIKWDPRAGTLLMNSQNPDDYSGRTQTPALGLLHELGHAYIWAKSEDNFNALLGRTDSEYTDDNEKFVIDKIETPAAKVKHEGVRENHFGTFTQVKGATTLPDNPFR